MAILPDAPKEACCHKCGGIKGQGYVHSETGDEMFDHCLGKLPGVVSACCGHGDQNGHLIFEDGTRIEFKMVRVNKELCN